MGTGSALVVYTSPVNPGPEVSLTNVNISEALCPGIFLPGVFYQRGHSYPRVSKPLVLRRKRKYHVEVCV